MELYQLLKEVREKTPLVQCITNFVTVNDCANILLAAGASPTMAMDIREVEESVEKVQALVCNLGAIESVDAMILAGKRANELGIPVVLDPVAAGGTTLRREVMGRLLKEVYFTVIRGNASEVKAIALGRSGGSGVDVSKQDEISSENLNIGAELIEQFAKQTGSVIVVSGVIDLISDGERTVFLHNGCPTMARITGSGCMVTTLIGGFCGANPKKPLEAALAAMAVMGVAGELAEERRLENRTGNATFRTDLIDAVFNMTEEQLKEKINYEIYKG